LNTKPASSGRSVEAVIAQIEVALDQAPPSEKIESIRRLIALARQSLEVDLSHPIEHRDAVLASAQALEAEFGDRAVRIANLIQAQLGNRAFNKCVAKTTEQLKWFRERTDLIVADVPSPNHELGVEAEEPLTLERTHLQVKL
jgi:hypothetical protein